MITKRFAIAALLIVGCASAPMATDDQDAIAKKFMSTPGAGTVYVSRPGGIGTSVLWNVYENGSLICGLPIRSFTRFNATPGLHTYTFQFGGAVIRQVELNTQPGELYFVELTNMGFAEQLSRERGEKSVEPAHLVQVLR